MSDKKRERNEHPGKPVYPAMPRCCVPGCNRIGTVNDYSLSRGWMCSQHYANTRKKGGTP